MNPLGQAMSVRLLNLKRYFAPPILGETEGTYSVYLETICPFCLIFAYFFACFACFAVKLVSLRVIRGFLSSGFSRVQ